MSIHQRDSEEIVKSNFVISCLAFRDSIPMAHGSSFYLMGFYVLCLKVIDGMLCVDWV